MASAEELLSRQTMRAIVQDRYGSAETLSLRDVAPPTVEGDDVLVRVAAAGMDRGAWHVMTGRPYLIRMMGYGLRAPKQPVPGTNLAGTVESVGPRVTRFRPGDEVYGIGTGAFAELACAPEDMLVRRPKSLAFEQAPPLSFGGLTALQAVRDQGKVESGQRVLVVGASGGVGSFAVQLAKAFGAEVAGMCSTAKVDFVRSLGADLVVDYTRQDVDDVGEHFDVVLDIGGNRPVSRLRRALTATGTLVIVGGEEGGALTGGLQRQLGAIVRSPFVGQKLGTFIAHENAADLATLNDLADSGALEPAIDTLFPLEAVADAVYRLESGAACGSIVLTT